MSPESTVYIKTNVAEKPIDAPNVAHKNGKGFCKSNLKNTPAIKFALKTSL